MTTSMNQRNMRRNSPNNPVRRRLTFGEDVEEQARVDNLNNKLQESEAKEYEEKSKKWGFDFINEVALNGPYEWYKIDGENWIGMKPRDCDNKNGSDNDQSSKMQHDNENTPIRAKNDTKPTLRERQNNMPERVIRQSVKRKVDFDCGTTYCHRRRHL